MSDEISTYVLFQGIFFPPLTGELQNTSSPPNVGFTNWNEKLTVK